MADADVLAWAIRDSRVLLTFDKDFGEMARTAALPETCGIILFRLPMPPPKVVGTPLMRMIMERQDWTGHFSVIEPGRVRMRRLAS